MTDVRRNVSHPTRRKFLKTVAAATVGINVVGIGKKARKPNLLFLWTDEQRADTMRVYGNRKIHAPNLDKLASESVVFRHTYVSQPVCTPSRSTVMTGLWPHAAEHFKDSFFCAKAEEFLLLIHDALVAAAPDLGLEAVKGLELGALAFTPHFDRAAGRYWEVSLPLQAVIQQ